MALTAFLVIFSSAKQTRFSVRYASKPPAAITQVAGGSSETSALIRVVTSILESFAPLL